MRGICTEKKNLSLSGEEKSRFSLNLTFGQTDGWTDLSNYRVASLLKTDRHIYYIICYLLDMFKVVLNLKIR